MKTFQVFSGKFATREEACLYTEAQWAPEPDESCSDEEYAQWEENNPTWQMKDDFGGGYLDSDFIETIHGDQILDYLDTQLKEAKDRDTLRNAIPQEHNALVLILCTAYEGMEGEFCPTQALSYHGEFAWNK